MFILGYRCFALVPLLGIVSFALVPLLGIVSERQRCGGREQDGGGAGVQQLLGIKATCGTHSCLVIQGQLGR